MIEPEKIEATDVSGQSDKKRLSKEQIDKIMTIEADHAKTVVIFIHGIGVQDRYQQLVSFTNGLRYTPKAGEFWAAKRGTDDIPQGQNVPLRIIPRHPIDDCPISSEFVDVDVCEIYWAPLLNGLTTWSAVLRWLGLTLKESFKMFAKQRKQDKNSSSQPENPLPTAKTSVGKWAWQIGYFATVFLLSVLLLWASLGVLLLNTDQLSNRDHRVISTPAFVMDEDFEPRGTKLRDAPLIAGVFTQGLTYILKRGNKQSAGVVDGLSVDTGKLLKQIDFKDLVYGLGYVAALFWLIVSIASLIQLLYNLVKTSNKEKRFKQAQNEDESSRATNQCSKERMQLISSVKQTFVGLLLSVAGWLFFDSFSKPIIVLVLFPLTVFLVLRKVLNLGLTDVLGDVEIYVTRNENNNKYKGREAVLQEATKRLNEVLQNSRYENVYIAGHSLGSVVGLEALRRQYSDYMLHYEDEAARKRYQKIKGFITFGSPLEKTLLFFYRDDYRSEFLEFNKAVDQRLFDLTPDNQKPLDDRHCIHWFNFWIASDIVCDPLGSYPITPHHEIELPGHRNLWSHSDYWTDPLFVRNFLRIIVRDNPKELNTLKLRRPEDN